MDEVQDEEWKVITLIITKHVNKEHNETKSIYETLKVAKTMIEDWMKDEETLCVVDKHIKKKRII